MNGNLTIILTIASIIVPVFATIYTGYIRIKNDNKEEHKPYLGLGLIETLDELDRYGYFYILPCLDKANLKSSELKKESRREDNINLLIGFRNIGYGVATNIKFFNLNDTNVLYGTQDTSDKLNQKKFTTFDISKDKEIKVQMCIIPKRDEMGEVVPETLHMICMYQDLNNNVYDFIIGIEIKKNGKYDFYAYQRSSHSYKTLKKYYKSNYRKIKRKYN